MTEDDDPQPHRHEPSCPRDGGQMVKMDQDDESELGAEWIDVGQYRCTTCGFIGWPV